MQLSLREANLEHALTGRVEIIAEHRLCVCVALERPPEILSTFSALSRE